METILGRELKRRRSFHTVGNPVTGGVRGEIWNLRRQQPKKKKITTKMALSGNYQQRSGSHTRVSSHQVGAGCGGVVCIIGP